VAVLAATVLVATGCTSEAGDGKKPDDSVVDADPAAVELVPDASLLPAAGADAVDDPKESAAALAAAARAGGEPAKAAMLTALTRSGFRIVDTDATTVLHEPAGAGEGVSVTADEVLTLTAHAAGTQTLLLDDLAASFWTIYSRDQVRDATPFVDALLVDLAEHAAGSNPARSFLAHFVSALGPDDAAPLLSAADGRELLVSTAQAWLMLRRLDADGRLELAGQQQVQQQSSRVPTVDQAAFGLPRQAGDDRCRPVSDDHALFEDVAAAGASRYFGKAVEWLAGQAVSNALGVVQAAWNLGKFIYVSAVFKAEITQLDPPIQRTKSTSRDGESGDVEITARMDVGRAEQVNCYRKYFALAGLDISLPQDGPVKNARVSWRCLAGGCVSGRSADPGLIFFTTPPGSPRTGGIVTLTDDAGRSRIKVTAKRQQRPVADGATEHERMITVGANVDLDPNSLVRDLVSAVPNMVDGNLAALAMETLTKALNGLGINQVTGTVRIVDYIDDYRVQFRGGAGFAMDGTFCNGPPFAATLPITGGVSVLSYAGSMAVDIGADGSGSYQMELTMKGPARVSFRSQARGDVRLVTSGDGALLEFLSGEVTGEVRAFGSSNPFPKSPAGHASVPLIPGDYC
jgi:hypothetical protein